MITGSPSFDRAHTASNHSATPHVVRCRRAQARIVLVADRRDPQRLARQRVKLLHHARGGQHRKSIAFQHGPFDVVPRAVEPHLREPRSLSNRVAAHAPANQSAFAPGHIAKHDKAQANRHRESALWPLPCAQRCRPKFVSSKMSHRKSHTLFRPIEALDNASNRSKSRRVKGVQQIVVRGVTGTTRELSGCFRKSHLADWPIFTP